MTEASTSLIQSREDVLVLRLFKYGIMSVQHVRIKFTKIDDGLLRERPTLLNASSKEPPLFASSSV